jgi:hypothetical protein
VPSRHLPRRDCDAAAGAAREVRSDAGDGCGLPHLVAEDVRRGLASVGLRSLEDAVGRVDLLRRRTTGDPRADLLELDSLVELPGDGPLRYAEETPAAAEGGELDVRLAVDAAGALRETRLIDLSYRIRNRDRAVSANLGGRLGRRFGTEPPPGRVRARFEGASRPKLRRVPRSRGPAGPDRGGERLRRQGHERRPHCDPPAGRRRRGSRPRRDQRAVRRDRRRALLCGAGRRAVRRARLRGERRHRGHGRTTSAST